MKKVKPFTKKHLVISDMPQDYFECEAILNDAIGQEKFFIIGKMSDLNSGRTSLRVEVLAQDKPILIDDTKLKIIHMMSAK